MDTLSASPILGRLNLRFAQLLTFLMFSLAGVAGSSAQTIVVDTPVTTAGIGATDLGLLQTGITQSTQFTFHVSALTTINSVSVDAGYGGVNDFSNVSWGGLAGL